MNEDKMKRLILFILIIIMPIFSNAQKLTLSGYVSDINLNPIEFAFVRVCKSDSTNLSGATTTADGKYIITVDKSQAGAQELHLNISHLSFKNQLIPIKLKGDTIINVFMEGNTYVLDDIRVTTQKKTIEFKDGNYVVNVSQISNAKFSDVAKLLSHLPGVTANESSELTLNGLPATLYIDGRKQNFNSGKVISFLKTLPVSAIEQIELNSMLSGRYDASSDVIINIKTKKQRIDGYFFSIGGQGSVFESEQFAGESHYFLMLKKKRVMLTSSFSYENEYVRRTTFDSTSYINTSSVIFSRINKIRTNIFQGSTNLSWEVRNGNQLNFNLYIYDDFGIHNNEEPIKVQGLLEKKIYTQYSKNRSHDDLWSGSIEYKSKDSLAYQYTISYGFLYGGLRSNSSYDQVFDNADDKEWFMDSSTKMIGYKHTALFDYTQKFNERLNLGLGAKTEIGALDDNVIFKMNPSLPNSYPASKFTGNENITALHFDLSYKISKELTAKSAIRIENTDYYINIKSEDQRTSQDYWSFFPHLSFLLKKKNYQTGFGITSGITRPNYEWMLPGIRFSDNYSYTVGNPELKPQKKYSLVWNNFLLNIISLNFRYTYTIDESGLILEGKEKDHTIYTYRNFADKKNVSANFSLPFEFFKKKFSGEFNTSVGYSKLYHSKNGIVIPKSRDHFTNSILSLNLQYQISNKVGVNMSTIHYPKSGAFQYDLKSRWVSDFGITYSASKNDKILFSFDATNVFNTSIRKYTYYYSDNIKIQKINTNDRYLRLSMIIKFNGGAKISRNDRKDLNDTNRFSKE